MDELKKDKISLKRMKFVFLQAIVICFSGEWGDESTPEAMKEQCTI